jgi:hypothetical protein
MESGKVIRLNQDIESYSRTTKRSTQSSPSPAIHFFLFHVFLFPERVPAAKSNGKHNITRSVATNVFEGTQLAPIQLKGHSQVKRQMECTFLTREWKLSTFKQSHLMLHPHPQFIHLSEVLKNKFYCVHHISTFPVN